MFPKLIPEPEAAIVLAAVEPEVLEPVISETQAPELAAAPSPTVPAAPVTPPATTPAEAPTPAKSKNTIKHGFNF